MDRKINEDINKEKYNANELLDFLDENDTYFVVDNGSGVVGNKKTGVMIDKRTGKVFSENSSSNMKDDYFSNNLKYDFLDYKKSVDVLNNSDNYKKEINEHKAPDLNKQKFKLRNYLGENFKNINKKYITRSENFLNKEEKEEVLDLKNNVVENEVIETPEVVSEISEDENNNEEVLAEDLLEDLSKQSDEEILKRINEKFNNVEEQISDIKDGNSSNDYDFAIFEEDEDETQKKNDELENVETENINYDEEDNEKNELDKFRMIMDLEDYLSDMTDDEIILKSPFEDEEDYEVPKVIVEEDANDDSFSPFDGLTSFEVEEIQSYDVGNDNPVEDGMIPEFNLNQGISKKVSIREVIKNKQKKKQEQKEFQEKMFFETLDERIEQFKKFKEHSIDSQEILNAINMDLNRINSSIRIEFESLNKKRKFPNRSPKSSVKKDDKFSLQNLLEEIYEENGEKPSSLDINELDIEAIKKDLAKKESSKNIVN